MRAAVRKDKENKTKGTATGQIATPQETYIWRAAHQKCPAAPTA